MMIARNMLDLTKVLEPGAAESAIGQSGAFELSKALSLKRIANALETLVQQRDADQLVSLPPSVPPAYKELRDWLEAAKQRGAFAGPDAPSNINFTDLTEEKKP